MDLTARQQEVLSTLVDRHQTTESPVTGEEIASDVGAHLGTVRNQMQSLKALSLVEGIPGPKGGYRPTTNAYEALDRQSIDDVETLTLAREAERVDVTVDEIDLVDVLDPDACRARITFQGPITDFEIGDPILVGPTPVAGLVVAGEIEDMDESTNEVGLDVIRLEAPVEEE